MDNRFSFLDVADARLIDEIVTRRNPALAARISQHDSLSPADAEDLIATLAEELVDNLGDDWEPSEYGRRVSAAQGRLNAARIAEWPT